MLRKLRELLLRGCVIFHKKKKEKNWCKPVFSTASSQSTDENGSDMRGVESSKGTTLIMSKSVEGKGVEWIDVKGHRRSS